ncbi:MAG: hypothetical protein SF029_16705 [bacterium]|nr:hypothetical protein [bacterium]
MKLPIIQTASVQRFIDGILDDLTRGCSTLVLLPEDIDEAQVWNVVQAALWQRSISVQEIRLLPEYLTRSPVDVIAGETEVEWSPPESPRILDNLLEHLMQRDFPTMVLKLEGVGPLESEGWRTLPEKWGAAAKSCAQRHVESFAAPPALCVIVSAAHYTHFPENDQYFNVHVWWQMPSAFEILLLCRFAESTPHSRTSLRWREHVLSSLVGGDATLVEFLWNDALTLDEEKLLDLLHRFGQKRGWSTECLKVWGVDDFQQRERDSLHLPPMGWRRLWTKGVVYTTVEYGAELHTAALAVLNRREDVLHRLWRGQAALLLPLLDQLRLEMCRRLTETYGREWPLWDDPKLPEEKLAVEQTPYACQWGHLETLLRHCHRLHTYQRWLPLVGTARRLRNELAHYHPVSYSLYAMLMQDAERQQLYL